MLKAFLKYLEFEKRYSPHTLTSYQNDLNQFEQFCQTHFTIVDLEKVEHRPIRAWVVHLMQQNILPTSINRKIASLKTLYKFAFKRGFIHDLPTQKVRSLKVPKRLPQFIQEQNMEDLLNSFETADGFEETRAALILEFLYGTGIRLSELIQLKETDINFFQNTIKVKGKGNKERIIPLHQQLVKRINQYINLKKEYFSGNTDVTVIVTNSGNQAYPVMINRIVKKYLSAFSTIEKRSPHVLRHSFATHLLNKGADLNAVKDLLGHSSLAATQVYTHNSLDKLKKAFDQAHPKA
jgi:integrase/recombinase XerC